MATSSYSNLFGTNGAGQQGSQAGISTMFGQQPRQRRPQAQPGQQQTFAQMQQQGQARPAPQMAQQTMAQPPMLRQLQQQLQPMGAAPARPGEVATRGQAAPAFDYAAMDRAMQQRQQMAAQRPPQPQPAPGTEVAGELQMTGPGSILTKYAGGYSPAELQQMQGQQAPQEIGRMPAGYAGRPGQVSTQPAPRPQPAPGQQEVAVAVPLDQQQMMYSRQAQPEMGISAPSGGMQMEYSQAGAPEEQVRADGQIMYSMAQPGGQTITEAQFGAPQVQSNLPPTPGAPTEMYQGLLSQLQKQIGKQFNKPSGYTTEEFQQLRQAQLGNLQAEFQGQQQALNEELARRGLSASSIGAGRMGDLAGQQSRAMASLEAQLLQQQAEAGQRGRETALKTLADVTGQLGAQAIGQQEVGLKAEQIRQQAAQFGLTLSEQQADRLQRLGISVQDLGLRAQQLQQEARAQGRELDIREAQNLAQNELEGRRIEQQQGQFTEQLRFNREELALRGDLGRAEQAMAERRLQQEGRLEESRQAIQLKELGQRESQFQQTLSAEDRRFADTLKEQQAGRLQQLGISTQQLDLEAQRLKQQADLEGRSLSLQEARDAAEVDFRTKNLQQQAALEGRRLTLDEARVQADNEFRADQLQQQDQQFRQNLTVEQRQFAKTLDEQRAARLQQFGVSNRQLNLDAAKLQQDAKLQGRTLDLQQARDRAEIGYRAKALQQEAMLQGKQLSAQKAQQQAQLQFDRQQLAVEKQLRQQGINVDLKQLQQAQRQFDADLAQRKEALTAQERQGDLDRQLREQLGLGELTGMVGGQQTVGARTAQQNLLVQLATALAGSEKGIPAGFLQQLYSALGVYSPAGGGVGQDLPPDRVMERRRGATTGTPTGTPGGTTTQTTTQTTSETAGPRRRGG